MRSRLNCCSYTNHTISVCTASIYCPLVVKIQKHVRFVQLAQFTMCGVNVYVNRYRKQRCRAYLFRSPISLKYTFSLCILICIQQVRERPSNENMKVGSEWTAKYRKTKTEPEIGDCGERKLDAPSQNREKAEQGEEKGEEE